MLGSVGELSQQSIHRLRAFVARRLHLGELVETEVLKGEDEIEDRLDFVQRCACDIEVLPKVLDAPATRTLRDIQCDAVGGASPLPEPLAAWRLSTVLRADSWLLLC